MKESHGGTIEKIGMGLVCAVEMYKGCSMKIVNRTLGFNGLSTNLNGLQRKIELKTMQKSDYWIAINGFTAIEKLFFDEEYWIYFAVVPENIVVMVKALPFIEKQLVLANNVVYLKDLENWIKQTKSLSKKSGLKIFPKINVRFTTSLRTIIESAKKRTLHETWNFSIAEIWELQGNWAKIYQSPEII
jgi:hypothetical protein